VEGPPSENLYVNETGLLFIYMRPDGKWGMLTEESNTTDSSNPYTWRIMHVLYSSDSLEGPWSMVDIWEIENWGGSLDQRLIDIITPTTTRTSSVSIVAHAGNNNFWITLGDLYGSYAAPSGTYGRGRSSEIVDDGGSRERLIIRDAGTLKKNKLLATAAKRKGDWINIDHWQ
jgi:hypothetical protein